MNTKPALLSIKARISLAIVITSLTLASLACGGGCDPQYFTTNADGSCTSTTAPLSVSADAIQQTALSENTVSEGFWSLFGQ
jgi:hypothetical protein